MTRPEPNDRSSSRRTARAGLAFVVLAFVVGGVQARGDGDETVPQQLFRIERSKNANVVIYEARVTSDGHLNRRKPVDAYWVELARDGRREKLSAIERRFAYGFKARIVDDSTVVLDMAADIGREITVSLVNGVSRATTEIAGHAAYLDRIYVHSIEKKLWPSVQYLDLHGSDVVTGESRYERVYP